MNTLLNKIVELRPYWIGALGGLFLGSAILGYHIHSQQRAHTEDMRHAISLSLTQLQLLEANFKPEAYLLGLYQQFGESDPGPINNHIELLVDRHEWIRQGVAEATIDKLIDERSKIDNEHGAAKYYDRVLDVAWLMYLKNCSATERRATHEHLLALKSNDP